MRALDRGEAFIVTRNSVPVGELRPLPRQFVSASAVAELAAGPHATTDTDERARRQERLQRAEATFSPLPLDGRAARAYGRIYATVAAQGRKARAIDLLIAATALAEGLPLYTRNPDDFRGLASLLEVYTVYQRSSTPPE